MLPVPHISQVAVLKEGTSQDEYFYFCFHNSGKFNNKLKNVFM